MKHESNESDIIVYDLPDDYSVSASSSSARPTEKKDKEKHTPILHKDHNTVGPKTLFGGITGKVYDKLTYRRVEGALVTVVKNLSVRTDERGEFFITNIKPGTYKVTVAEDGYMVQYRKGTVVPGETTKLESFHLVPSCLAADYPDEVLEEETIEEVSIEAVETAVEIPVEPPPLEIHEEIITRATETVDEKIEKDEAIQAAAVDLSLKTKTACSEVSDSDIIVVEEADRKIITDFKPRETAIKEKLIELPDAIVDKQILSALEKAVEKETIADIFVVPVEGIEDVLSDKNISISDEEIRASEIDKVSAETAAPLPEEKSFTETTISVTEETAVEEIRAADVTSQEPDETVIVEATKPENLPQETAGKETESRLPWMAWLRRKLKGKLTVNESTEQPLEAALGSQDAIIEETHGEGSPEEIKEAIEKIETATRETIGEEPQGETLTTKDISQSDDTISAADEEGQAFIPELDYIKPAISTPVPDYFIDTSLSMPEEIVFGDIPSVHEVTLMFDETRATEIMRMERTPREISINEMAVVEKIEHGMITDKIFREEPPELPIGAIIGFTPQKPAIGIVRENELFAGITSVDRISIINEEIQLPVIVGYLVETAISLPEERNSMEITTSETEQTAPEELSFDEMVFQISDESGTMEMAHLEEVERVFSKEETQSRLPWKRWVKNRVKRKFSKQDLLMPSKEDVEEATAHNRIAETETQLQEELPESFIEVTDEITDHDIISVGTHQKELSADVSVEEIIDYRVMHKTITELNKQKESAGIKAEVEDKQEEEMIVIEERPADISDVYVFADGSAIPKVLLEGLSDDEIASLSEEERAAMLSEHNSVEMAGLIGIVNAQPNPSYKGLPISVAFTLKNVTCDNPEDFVMQITVANSDTGAIFETFETLINCCKGTFSIGGFVIFTTSYETGIYRLNMQIVSEKTKTSHLLANIPLEIKPISFNL